MATEAKKIARTGCLLSCQFLQFVFTVASFLIDNQLGKN